MRTGNRRERQKSPSPGRNPRRNSFRKQKTAASVFLPIISTYSGMEKGICPHSPEEVFHPRFVEALQKQDHVEYLLDVLLFGETEEKAALITDYGKDVIQLEQRMAELAAADAARTKNTMNAMQPPQSVEEVKATLETTEKGGVRQSIRNCLTVFQRDPVLAGAIAYNILTDRKDIIKPIGFHRESTALTDTDMKYLLLYLEETYGLTSEKKD